VDREEAVTKDEAVRLLLMTAGGTEHTNERWHKDNCARLAMQWPSLAAALAEVLVAHDKPVPQPFRAAANVMRGEMPVGAPVLPLPATDEGEWCWCREGGVHDGKGHLKGMEGCNVWCLCAARNYPHQHDGTLPGSPVIT
jgi:hypothetical protein